MPSAGNAQGKALRINDAEGCLVEMRRDAASSFHYKKNKKNRVFNVETAVVGQSTSNQERAG